MSIANMLMAPGAEIPMLPKKVHGCKKSKVYAPVSLPCNGAPALLEQAFGMRISMQAQWNTRLHNALVTHIYRQTKGIRK